MNLYKLTQTEHTGYDTFDTMVVAAENEAAARLMHPWYGCKPEEDLSNVKCWATRPENVVVELIGIAIIGIPAGIICDSFNAG